MDDQKKRETQPIIGARMRELRKAKHLTLKQLAAETGLSIGYLSQLERQDADPSIRALNVIGKALGVGINWFFPGPEDQEGPEAGLVVRAGQRRSLRFASGLRDELLSPSLSGQLEMVLTTFEPGAGSGAELYSHKGEEAGYIAEGQLEVTVDDITVLLQAGDTIQFSSERPHRYHNPGPKRTVLVWAVTPPHY
ncbi:DNA-binding protein, putative [Roseobacter sp. SK209-2-6]|uniref:helix-turn-helix domain-containing protein n=1 Tax=Roseobacter sp. SK209-2-6 TaxID=388739 RepID=UPI0000F3C663|nr:XRE family transcriptional regulator [Roseobacter sp. SK209-2-6]EBA18760.1 DNA-binding protein, putative [Roseobacter sp. SK209-2-6]